MRYSYKDQWSRAIHHLHLALFPKARRIFELEVCLTDTIDALDKAIGIIDLVPYPTHILDSEPLCLKVMADLTHKQHWNDKIYNAKMNAEVCLKNV